MNERVLEIELDISYEAFLKWYQGAAQVVVATSRCGLKVQFPASSLRPFVSHQGVRGHFQIVCDADGKLLKFNRVVGES